jgi:hypothetical protein
VTGAPALEDLAVWANGRARELVLQEGTHDTTVMLRLPDGSIQTQIVGGDGGTLADVVEAIADEADQVDAEAVVVIAEWWSAANPEREAAEILLVAGVDVGGDAITFETPLLRHATHREAGETVRTDAHTVLLDAVRQRWDERR